MNDAAVADQTTRTNRKGVWITIAAVAAVAVLLLAGYGWARHQQLGAAEDSVAANLDVPGVTMSIVMRGYTPVLAPPNSGPPFLGIAYWVSDSDAALAAAEAQLEADGWVLVDESRGETTSLTYEKEGSGVRGVEVAADGGNLYVTITAEP